MRILFLSHYFPPEVNAPASRTYEHCREWAARGHDVVVVTCAPNHPTGRIYAGYRNRLVQREVIDGVTVLRVWTYVTANEAVVKRTLSYVSYLVSATLITAFVRAPDVVISTSPQFFNGIAGYLASRLKRRPWVLEIRDLWPESIVAVGAMRNGALVSALERLARFAYRKADVIVSVTDSFKRHMVGLGIAARKIEVVKNGVDLAFYGDQPGGCAPEDARDLQGRFVVAYFGTHGMAHHLETVLEAADILRERDDIVFLLVGDGAERQRLLRLRDERGLRNVRMLGQQAKALMPYWWQIADASMVLLKAAQVFTTVIPSKIFESMAMRKPIILGVAGESREIVEAASAGVCIEPESATDLARAVETLAASPELCSELGRNGREFVCRHHDRTRLAARYEVILSAAARRAPLARTLHPSP